MHIIGDEHCGVVGDGDAVVGAGVFCFGCGGVVGE